MTTVKTTITVAKVIASPALIEESSESDNGILLISKILLLIYLIEGKC